MMMRDHSRPCEHFPEGERARDGITYSGHRVAGAKWCPGGAVVTIDYEAALKQYLEIAWGKQGMEPHDQKWGKVDLGDGSGRQVPISSDFDAASAIVNVALGLEATE